MVATNVLSAWLLVTYILQLLILTNANDPTASAVSHNPLWSALSESSMPLHPTIMSPHHRQDLWHGFLRHKFIVPNTSGVIAWVVEPRTINPLYRDKPWTWCMEFPDAFTHRTGIPQLLEKGFHHVHIDVGIQSFASPRSLKQFDKFYEVLQKGGLSRKGALVGLSRGGLYAYRFATIYPHRVACIYGDAPVLDIKSWPGGKFKGLGSPKDWQVLIQKYNFANEQEALEFKENPVENTQLAAIAKAKLRILHVVGDNDDVVPVAENSAIVESRLRALGLNIQVIHKPGVKHHPHGLEDPTPLIKFIEDSYTEA